MSLSDELSIDTVDFTPDGKLLVGISNSTISILRTSPNFEVYHEIMSETPIDTAKFSPDGNFLAVGFNNGKIFIYDTRTFVLKSSLLSDFGGYWTLTWIRNTSFIAGGHYEPFVSIFDISKQKRIQLLDPNIFDDSGRTAIYFDKQIDILLSSAYNQIIGWSTAKNDKMKKSIKFKSEFSLHIVDIAFSFDKNVIAGLANDGDKSRILFWDMKSGEEINSMNLPHASKRIYWNTVENFIAVTEDSSNGISFWDTNEYTMLPYCLEDSSLNDFKSLVMHDEKQWLVIGGEFGNVAIWEIDL